ncbi:MAG: FAD:protein FMN transferase [Gammaproteobacteria bacterium]
MSVAACDRAVVTTTSFPAFGTDVRVEILHAEPEQANAATTDLENRFRRAGLDWYAFGTGELARVNGLLLQGKPASVSAELSPLIARAIELHARSDGLFDPGVCALVRLWRFDSAAALATAGATPPEAEIRALRARQGTLADVRFDGHTVSATRPLCIDLGGMAKGTALEQARAVLARHGIRSALIDIGGSSQLAVGQKGTRPWFIGLKHPRANGVIGRLALDGGEAASTSGDYERGYTRDDHHYHHILDPRTGAPTTGTASVTVLASDAERADAASTALMVAGPIRFRAISAALGIRDAFLITTSGELLTTPGMARRLRRDNDGRLPVIDWPKQAANL